MRAVPVKRDLPVTLMLRWCFNNFLHTEQGERGGEGCSTHTHTAMDTPPCPSNTVWIQIVANQNVLCEHSEGSEQQSIVALKHKKSQWSTCLGQAFVIICLFFWISSQPWRNPHCCLSRVPIDTFSWFIWSLQSSGTCPANTVVFFPAFWLAF